MNKISNSSVDLYLQCSLCWKLKYIDRIRPVRQKSALLFGSALDTALNHLLLTRNHVESFEVFHQQWNKVDCDLTDFSKSDLDEELLASYTKEIPENKNASWQSLAIKGHLFILQYHKDILPKIKKVIAVQESVSLKNFDGDEIIGILDLIVEWEDGKTYLLDNKSSSVKYAPDSAKTGQQLPLYYYIVKDRYKLDGVGYIVLSKKINKNKVKKCKTCGTINTGSHKSCNILIENIDVMEGPEDFSEGRTIETSKIRCNGEFNITINPSVDWEVIINQVDENDEARVIKTFDEVNDNIVNGRFATEHNPNKNKFFQYCSYKEYYEGNPAFIKLEKKDGA